MSPCAQKRSSNKPTEACAYVLYSTRNEFNWYTKNIGCIFDKVFCQSLITASRKSPGRWTDTVLDGPGHSQSTVHGGAILAIPGPVTRETPDFFSQNMRELLVQGKIWNQTSRQAAKCVPSCIFPEVHKYSELVGA